MPQKQNTNNDKHYAFQKIFEKINHNIISNDDVFKMAINKINDEYDAALLALITELLDRIEKQITELNKKQEQIDRLINVIDKLTNNMITNEIETIKKDI